MAWSTRQVAALAGTTEKAVRHYHRIGLLEEPARAANGYKQYRTTHLVRLVHIARLRELGVPLARIGGAEPTDEALRTLHRELGVTVERLQHLRAELAALLRHRAPLDTPAEFAAVSEELSRRDRALVTVFSRVWTDELDDLRTLVSERDDYEDALDALPADAPDAAIEAVAQRMAVALARDQERFPWLRDPAGASARGRRFAESVAGPAVAELFNGAQLKVFLRAVELVGSAGTDGAVGGTDA